MPTNKPRIFVTLDPELYDGVRTYMQDHHLKSLSSAASYIIADFLFDYFNHKLHGVTLFDMNLDFDS